MSEQDMDIEGTVRDGQIHLERPLADLEGRRVRVHVELVDEAEPRLTADEQRAAWAGWVARGPQGPIEDDDDLPDEP